MPVTRARRGPIALAVALLAGVAIAAWQVTLISEPTVGVGVGPRAMPAALVALLAALGAAYLWSALRGRQADLLDDPTESAQPGAGSRVALLALGLATILLLTPLAGIGVACSLAFALVARAFGSRRALHDLVVGVLFVFVAWFVFDRLLGVQLGRFASFVPWP
jgi:putative tricarboxylic transport membrane protein